MKRLISIILAFAAIATSCNKSEMMEYDFNKGSDVISAVIKGANTKTAIDNNSVKWSTGDQFSLITADTRYPFTLSGGEGTTSGTFTGTIPTSEQVLGVVFPHNDNNLISSNTLSVTLANSYTMPESDVPMWGTYSNGSVTFQHLAGVLKFALSDIPSGYKILKVTADKPIAGSFKATIGNNMQLEPADNNTSADNKVISINYSESTDSDNDRVMFIPLPAATYGSMKLEISKDGNNFVELLTWLNRTVECGKIYTATRTYGNISGGTPNRVEVAGTETDDITREIANAPAASTIVINGKVTTTTENNQITLPTPTNDDSNLEIQFNQAPSTTESTPLVLHQEGGNSKDNNVEVVMPDDATGLNVNITMPNTTTTLNGGSYNNVESSTAENTLVVLANTTIKNLKVLKGNVRLAKDAIINAITLGEGVSITLILEEDATQPSNLPAGVSVMSAAEWESRVVVTSNDELSAALSNNEVNTIVLGADLTLTEILSIERTLTLDGNGKTLTSSAGRAINVETEGSVTIKNLTIKAAERAINIINKAATVNVNKVTATANNNAIMIATSAGAAKLTVEDSDLTGLAVINVAGAGAQVEIKSTKITCNDQNANEAYGAITFYVTAENSTVSVDANSTITVEGDSKNAYVFPETATITGVDNVGYVYATIGDNGCESLAEAIEEAEAGQTIKILRDITASEIITINKAITLDGNGKTLTYTGTNRAFQITGGNVVINNLTIEMPNASEGNRGINLYNGETNSSIDVTLNGVTVEGGKAYAVNIGGGKDNNLTIKNSTLTGYAAINVNAASEKHTINVEGCTLTGNNHNTGYDFGVVVIDGTNAHTLEIANTTISANNNEGVTTVYNQLVVGPNCKYEVDDKVTDIAVRNILANGLYYTDLQAAVNEANVNSTVTLLGDIQIEAIIEINNSITLDLNGKTISQTSSVPVSMITNKGQLTIKDSGNGSGKIAFTFNGTVDATKAANAISNYGTLTIEGGAISNTGTGNQIGYAIDNYNGAILTVNGGDITASGSSYYDGIRLFCGSTETTVTVNAGNVSTIWAQNPSANKATEVHGTVIINGGTVGTTYYENYTVVKVKSGVNTTVTAYGAGSDNTTTTTDGDYTVYSFQNN